VPAGGTGATGDLERLEVGFLLSTPRPVPLGSRLERRFPVKTLQTVSKTLRRRVARGIAALLLATSLPLAAALAADAPAAAAKPASPLAKLAWMSGSWTLTQGDRTVEEHWTSPEGGLMLGMNRATRGGRAVMFEFLRIVARGDSIAYVALPRGRGETTFPLKEMSEKRVVFENPTHDYPQRILYWQPKLGELSARTEGLMDGKPVTEEWTWKRTDIVP